MTNHRALSLPFFTTFAVAMLFALPVSAQETECQPDDLFCAELRIGPGSAGIRIGGSQPQPPPPPPVIAPAPQPPVVIVQPQPPMPQPPQVVVQPVPPPPVVQRQVVVQPLPRQRQQVVYMQQQPQQRQDRFPYSSVGIHLHADGLFGADLAMMGAGAAFRIRPNPHFALDIGAGVYGGNDYNGMDRLEVPLVADALFFFNPQHRFQFYAVAGVGASFGFADGENRFTGLDDSREYFHLGGEAGLGLEWRISRVFALNIDARAFVREQLGDNDEAEFRERNDDGNWQETNTSGGVTARFGMTFYFGD